MSNEKTQNVQKQEDVLALIGAPNGKGKRRGRRALRWTGLGVLAIVLLAAGLGLARTRASQEVPAYTTEPVTRGTLRVTVTATGNLQPIKKVDLGSELSGLVDEVLVDDNDHVTKGQVLARLDISKLKDAITRSQATLASAEANEAQAKASVKEASANLHRLQEVSRLSGGKVPSKAEMETAEATLAKAEAQLSASKASVSEARAQLSTDTINLSKSSIRSPIDGVVLKRSVEPGQTVAASFQVATLFTIAEDLREMELEVAVDEADVGSVKEGQQATFTVDAYPNRTYAAHVTRVAYGSTTSNNVVSYTTTLRVKNDDQSLRPGMTATAEIATTTSENVLLAPNAALRFAPAATAAAQSSANVMRSLMPGPPREREKEVKTNGHRVWVLRNGQPAAIGVAVGPTDGQHTEVSGEGLSEGLQVITDATGAGQ
ncbi:MAG: efflux pump, family, rane fusion protein [Acidobacteria bacterium]|nr:efflux pump, family, rane fusion protein [Acidobacteriota bacterium]